jgi:hypothetical protein
MVHYLKRSQTTITYCLTQIKVEVDPHRVINLPASPVTLSQFQPGCYVVHAGRAKIVQMRIWRIHEQKVFSFPNIPSRLIRLLLSVKHFAMPISIKKCRIRRYTDWLQHNGHRKLLREETRPTWNSAAQRRRNTSKRKLHCIVTLISLHLASTALTRVAF